MAVKGCNTLTKSQTLKMAQYNIFWRQKPRIHLRTVDWEYGSVSGQIICLSPENIQIFYEKPSFYMEEWVKL